MGIVILVHSEHSVLHSSVDPINTAVISQQLQRFQAVRENTTAHNSTMAGIASRAMHVQDEPLESP